MSNQSLLTTTVSTAESGLSISDIIAGGVLLVYGIIGLVISGIVAAAIYTLAQKMNGFILIFSEAIANMLLIFQFGVWNGTIILIQTDPLISFRWSVATTCDFFWFAMAQHYPLVASTRFAAIKWPMEFKNVNAKHFISVCIFFWCFAIIQSVCLHLTPWFALFYFDPAITYGMTTNDWVFYGNNGTDLFWRFYHGTMIGTPLLFYVVTIILLLKQNKGVAPVQEPKKKQSRSLSVEKRLLIPCAINSMCYLLGKIAFDMSNFGGKWGGWFYSFVFLTNSFVTPIILVAFSTVVRNKVLEIVKLRQPEPSRTAMSQNMRSNSRIASEAGSRRSSVRPVINVAELK